MFKISEFSRLSQVTAKTLRYYDQLGLLRPARLDRDTGYRYYSADQLPRLHRLLALKDLGFSLEQIGRFLDDDLSLEEMRGMLRLRQAEVQQALAEEQARLRRVEARLRILEKESPMSEYDVVLKSVEPIRVASVRDVIPNYAAVGMLFDAVCPFLQQQNVAFAGPAIAIYYDKEYKESDVDVEAAVPIAGTIPPHERITVRELPAVPTMACLIHHGAYEGLFNAYQAIMRWIEENGYRVCGPNREIYLRCHDEQGNQDGCLTEIQVPVEKG